jgi:hypothetical protein
LATIERPISLSISAPPWTFALRLRKIFGYWLNIWETKSEPAARPKTKPKGPGVEQQALNIVPSAGQQISAMPKSGQGQKTKTASRRSFRN